MSPKNKKAQFIIIETYHANNIRNNRTDIQKLSIVTGIVPNKISKVKVVFIF